MIDAVVESSRKAFRLEEGDEAKTKASVVENVGGQQSGNKIKGTNLIIVQLFIVVFDIHE